MKNKLSHRFFLYALLVLSPFLFTGSSMLDDTDQRFSLSNYTVFSPGDKVTVDLYGHRALEKYTLRLLRISDPLDFLKEFYPQLKTYQFDIWGSKDSHLLEYVELEREWEYVPGGGSYDYNQEKVDLGEINEPGIYILQGFAGGKVAYCPVVVTSSALVYRSTGSQVLAFVTNMKTGEFAADAEVMLFTGDSLKAAKALDDKGFVMFDLNEGSGSSLLLAAETEDEILFSNTRIFVGGTAERLTGYIYTNQPVYRPGANVSFKAILRKHLLQGIEPVTGETASVEIKSPRNKTILSTELTTNMQGSLFGNAVLGDEADLGTYSIIVHAAGTAFYGNFQVEEYKKPEYEVKVELAAEHYTRGDTVSGVVKSDYYFGSPVSGAAVAVNVYRRQYWRPWWYWSEYAWFYSQFYKRPGWGGMHSGDFLRRIEGTLNEEGEFVFSYPLPDEDGYDYVFDFRAEVTDDSRRTIAGSAETIVSRGSFSVSAETRKYFVRVGEAVSVNVKTYDFSNAPVTAEFEFFVNREVRAGNQTIEKEVFSESYTTDGEGMKRISFTPNEEGYYKYTVAAEDERGRKIYTAGSFFVAGESHSYYSRYGGGLEIVTSQSAYEKGDTLRAIVFVPFTEGELLVSFDKKTFLDYSRIEVTGGSFSVEKVLMDEYAPGFNLSVIGVNEGTFYQENKLIGVLAVDQFLDIAVQPDREIYAPGDSATVTVTVTGSDGEPVEGAELSLGTVDEAVYAIREESVQDIKTFYYAPQYSWISTNVSILNHSYSAMSRDATRYDREFVERKDEDEDRPPGKLQGTFELKGDHLPGNSWLSVKVSVTDGRRFKTTAVDTSGMFSFSGLSAGVYDVLLRTDNNVVMLVGEATVKAGGTTEKLFILDTEKLGRLDYGFFGFRDAPAPMMETMTQEIADEAEGGARLKKSNNTGADLKQPVVREKFADAAFWQAVLVTGADGKASASFKLPDNLTAWRSTIRAITPDTRVGQTTDKFLARKDLLLRVETPRFFRQHDTLLVRTTAHNYLDEEKDVRLSFEAEQLKVLGAFIEGEQLGDAEYYDLAVKPDGKVSIDWRVAVTGVSGEAVISSSALTNEESDAVLLKVPVHPFGVRKIDTGQATLADGDEEELTFTIPDAVDLRSAVITISANPSPAAAVLQSLDDLVDYPYGCVEQTMSRFLPALVVQETFQKLEVELASETMEKLPEVIEKGLQRLYNFQHGDGGWGWWKNDDSNPFMSAYVVYGMLLARQADYAVNQNSLTRGLSYVHDQFINERLTDKTTLAYMGYVLALGGELAGMEDQEKYAELLAKLSDSDINAYGLSLLGLAQLALDDKEAAAGITAQLVDMAEQSGGLVSWGGKQWHYRWQDDRVQTTAWALKYIVNAEPESELIPHAVQWLLTRQRGTSWNSTQQTAMVVFGMTDYLAMTGELQADFNSTVFLNGKIIIEKTFTQSDVLSGGVTMKCTLPDGFPVKHGTNLLTLTMHGEGRLYVSASASYFTDELNNIDNEFFEVSRNIFKLKPESTANGIFYKKSAPENIVSGDLLLVKVGVSSRLEDLQYLMVEDMLPSGVEVELEEGLYNIEGEDEYGGGGGPMYPHYWRWWYADREVRDEKISWFITHANKQMNFSYIIRVQIPGEFSMMPAEASLMYYPEVRGTGKGEELTVN